MLVVMGLWGRPSHVLQLKAVGSIEGSQHQGEVPTTGGARPAQQGAGQHDVLSLLRKGKSCGHFRRERENAFATEVDFQPVFQQAQAPQAPTSKAGVSGIGLKMKCAHRCER